MLSLTDSKLLRGGAYIDGDWLPADSGKVFVVSDPATGHEITTVPDMGTAETRRAIEAAHAALPGWRGRTAKERAAVLRKWFELVMASQEDLARILTAEQGKPLKEARGEVAFGASFIEWFAEEAKRVYGDVIPQYQGDRRVLVLKEPIGVCATITPWNFPSAMVTRNVSPALAVGCTLILKPAEQTPLSALALAELASRAGLPKGVLNVITGDAPTIGEELTQNRHVRKLSFTGSTEVGKRLLRQCAGTVKKVTLELGGNAPLIVFDDADLEAAVEGAVASKFRNAGQNCVSTNRLLVHDKIHDDFVRRLTQRVQQLRVGNGMEPDVTIGPLVDQRAVASVTHHIDDAVQKGATVATGGKAHSLGRFFFEPTILTNVTSSMCVAKEEIFGPVAPIFRFKDDEEAIRIANDTESGLAAYFYTRDIGRMWRCLERLECGILGVNTGMIGTETAPFGGVKESGIGREGSKYGLEPFLEIKYVCIGGVDR